MKFKITITEIREVKKPAERKWVKVGDACYHEPDQPKTRIDDVYGYAPEIEVPTIEETEILKQQVDVLDLEAVIKAVNRIK